MHLVKDTKPRLCKEGEPLQGKDVLDLVLKRLNIQRDNPRMSVCFEWQKIIGDRLYPHIKIIDIKGTTLLLRADHPSWAQIALLQQKKIISSLNKKYPSLGIQSIQMLNI